MTSPGGSAPASSHAPRSFNSSLADDRRLLLLSSRVRNKPAMYAAAFPGVRIVEFAYETTTLEEILEAVAKALEGKKVGSITCTINCDDTLLKYFYSIKLTCLYYSR